MTFLTTSPDKKCNTFPIRKTLYFSQKENFFLIIYRKVFRFNINLYIQLIISY